jgi:hypothetical protein
MTTYVHAPGSKIYHWCQNCSQYPPNAWGGTTTRPEDKLCEECKTREREGKCRM